jgi:hypothetical protein
MPGWTPALPALFGLRRLAVPAALHVRAVRVSRFRLGASPRDRQPLLLDRHPSGASPRLAGEIPYVAALVELDEGVRMASRLLNCDRNALQLGIRVELIFRGRHC